MTMRPDLHDFSCKCIDYFFRDREIDFYRNRKLVLCGQRTTHIQHRLRINRADSVAFGFFSNTLFSVQAPQIHTDSQNRLKESQECVLHSWKELITPGYPVAETEDNVH